ncbi:MAG TPA: tRNA pseudouridine(55) synthase TruB [Methylomirabilota bacterium]|jgi:tRNA pseudouridine55 synthase|nr:tRNA pseudouridine(55) synthase TruB [Methylomirabilota bacterium]
MMPAGDRASPPAGGSSPVVDGILIAEKGAGVTSFQVVAHLRRVLRVPKVGHGGTLDPMATGVLPILLGQATKLTPYLQAQDKEYVATVRLGVTTDTLDATGRVTGERPVPPLDAETIRAALARFIGEIEQVPPMFSALHAGGRRLHELARAGIEVARPARRVRIDALQLIEWAPPSFTIRVACGTGTYVRSLAADLGAALGCGAHLGALERTRLGSFALAEAVPWAVIREGEASRLRTCVLPADRAVAHLPAVRLDAGAARRLLAGQRLPAGEGVASAAPSAAGPCRLYADDGFFGVGEAGAGGLRALRLLYANHPRARPLSC